MFLLISECPGTALQMQLARAWDPQQEFPRCQEQVPIPLAQPSHPLLEGAEPQAPPRRVDPQASKALYSSFLSFSSPSCVSLGHVGLSHCAQE